MKYDYRDIRKRIPEEPTWYDENGVPRYCGFIPMACPNIYATQIVLLKIACQACQKEFLVEMHDAWFSPIKRPKELHYGDPPAHGCVGDTMNCEGLEVLQVWCQADGDWKRHESLEGLIE